MLESLLRCYPAEVFEGICGDGKAKERMTNMLKFIGFPPVCELLVMLVALTPVPRTGQLYTSCAKSRGFFLDEMNNWNFMLQICKVIAKPDQYCALNSFVNADQHSTAAVQLLQEMIEKISLEESGESLLQPIGASSAIVDALMDGIVKPRVNPHPPLLRQNDLLPAAARGRYGDSLLQPPPQWGPTNGYLRAQ